MIRDPLPWDVVRWRNSKSRLEMTTTERAIYRELCDYQWLEGSIPDDRDQMALIASVSSEEMNSAYPRIRKQFVKVPSGRLQNAVVEQSRSAFLTRAAFHEERARKAAATRWNLANRISELHATSNANSNARASPKHEQASGVCVCVSGVNSEELGEHRNGHTALVVQDARARVYDPGPGWNEILAACKEKPVAPKVRKPQLALQSFLSCCESQEHERRILAGIQRYKQSDEVARGVIVSLENFIADGMYEGIFAPFVSESDRERERMRAAL